MNANEKIGLLRAVLGRYREDERLTKEYLSQFVPCLDGAISTLDKRQAFVLRKRFCEKKMTFKELSGKLPNLSKKNKPCRGISTVRVQQIEGQALWLLRRKILSCAKESGSRMRHLKGRVEDEYQGNNFINDRQ